MSKALQQPESVITRIRINWMQLQILSELGSYKREGKWYVLMDLLNSANDIKDGIDKETGALIWTCSNEGRYVAVPVEVLKEHMRKYGTEVQEQLQLLIGDCNDSGEIERGPKAPGF